MPLVTVLAGGNSEERDVSLRSGQAVAAALERAGYQVRSADPADGLKLDELAASDVLFPVLHGLGGEDGELQTQLDKQPTPYVGSGAAASALCFDKARYKQLLTSKQAPVPQGTLVSENDFWQSPLIKNPFVLKPNDGGSSIDNLVLRDTSSAPDRRQVADLFSRHHQMLLEELIKGVEITVAVLGSEALPVIEIIPPLSGEFDYENKYNGQTQELCPPQHVTQTAQKSARELALQIHTYTGCRDFSRTDIIVGDNDNLTVLETNTIPGMTDQSLFPKAAQAAGLSMEQLVDQLVKLALSR